MSLSSLALGCRPGSQGSAAPASWYHDGPWSELGGSMAVTIQGLLVPSQGVRPMELGGGRRDAWEQSLADIYRVIILSKALRTPLWKTLHQEEEMEEEEGIRVGRGRTWGRREAGEVGWGGRANGTQEELGWVGGPRRDHHLLGACSAPRWRCGASQCRKPALFRAQGPAFPLVPFCIWGVFR